MNEIIFIGAQRKTGEYQGRKYDNTYLHFAEKKSNCIGFIPFSVKVKSSNISTVCGINSDELEDYCLYSCDLLFNRFGSVDRVTFIDSDDSL